MMPTREQIAETIWYASHSHPWDDSGDFQALHLAEADAVLDLLEHSRPERIDELTAARDKFRGHSIELNRLAWRIAVAVGDVDPEAEDVCEADVHEQLDRLIARSVAPPEPEPAPTHETCSTCHWTRTVYPNTSRAIARWPSISSAPEPEPHAKACEGCRAWMRREDAPAAAELTPDRPTPPVQGRTEPLTSTQYRTVRKACDDLEGFGLDAIAFDLRAWANRLGYVNDDPSPDPQPPSDDDLGRMLYDAYWVDSELVDPWDERNDAITGAWTAAAVRFRDALGGPR